MIAKKIVQTCYAIVLVAVAYVEFVTSSGFFDTLFYTILGGFFWPVTVGIWIGRGWLFPLLRAHGVL